MPAHTLLDAALRYERGPWQAALSFQQPDQQTLRRQLRLRLLERTVTASLKYRF
ncbi:MAG: hypothetical protein Q4A97_10755 [Comamonadaceae bacterium]|nr:hypothetical protein [Comamonadaceae bacterium]